MAPTLHLGIDEASKEKKKETWSLLNLVKALPEKSCLCLYVSCISLPIGFIGAAV